MKSETEAFLELVRDAEQPTAADEARVRRALQAAVAAGMVASVSVPADWGGGWWGRALAKLGSIGAKLGVIGACTTSLLLTSDTARPPTIAAKHVAVTEARAAAPPQPRHPAVVESPLAEPSEPGLQSLRAPQAVPAKAVRSRPAQQYSLRSELDLLERVQAALKRGDGAEALRVLDTHRSSDRMLLAERQAARVLALCQLDRVAEARRAAARFAVQHPDSMQRQAIADSCANR